MSSRVNPLTSDWPAHARNEFFPLMLLLWHGARLIKKLSCWCGQSLSLFWLDWVCLTLAQTPSTSRIFRSSAINPFSPRSLLLFLLEFLWFRYFYKCYILTMVSLPAKGVAKYKGQRMLSVAWQQRVRLFRTRIKALRLSKIADLRLCQTRRIC